MARVFINPGHAPNGRPDAGASGNGYRESDLAWELGVRVQRYLIDAGCEAPFMQSNSLEDIVTTANESNADLFVSIHMNGFTNPSANGVEVFSGGSIKSNTAAVCVLNQLVAATGVTNRGVKTDSLYVTRNTSMPAILVEVGFITNASDCDFVVNHYDEIAAAIARGVTDYFQQI